MSGSYGALDWCCGRGCCLMHVWMDTSPCLHPYEIRILDLEDRRWTYCVQYAYLKYVYMPTVSS